MERNIKKCTVPADDVKRVKGMGFLWAKTTEDKFNARVITVNGKITAEDMETIAEAAKRFGSGEVAMTTRLTIEIQSVPYENIDALVDFLGQHGLKVGGTGPKVRPVVSCKGTTCQYGLIDTFDLSRKIHERFYDGYRSVTLPHKFKIAVGGCPNNCVKPNLNDIGIVGQKIPAVELEKCRGCKVCNVEKNCPIKHARLVDGKIKIDLDECNHCGRCDTKCPFGAVANHKYGYRVYIGGRWGKKVAMGQSLTTIFFDEGEVLDIVEKAILLFKDMGNQGERFADTVNRLGLENVERILLSDELLARKDEIITK